MPHDRFDREIVTGDWVKAPDGENTHVIGRVGEIYPGSAMCNATIHFVTMGGVSQRLVTLKDCELELKASGVLPGGIYPKGE